MANLFDLHNVAEGLYKYTLVHDDGQISFMDMYVDADNDVIRHELRKY